VSVLYYARRYAEAVEYSLKIKQDSPELFRFPGLLGHSLLMLGRTDEAAVAFGQSIVGEGLLAARSGHRELALAKVAALKEQDREFEGFNSARIYAQLGDEDAAFQGLHQAWDVRDANLLSLKVDPYLDPLRGDARYAELIARLGLPA
jgi:Flp pilus assembly protein TadD